MSFLAPAFRCTGDVLPRAAAMAFPGSLLVGILKYYERNDMGPAERLDKFETEWHINGAAFTSFTGLLGILIVFRTSQAYARYWEGFSLMQSITGNFFDSASSVMSYTVMSSAHQDKVMEFRQTVASLTSLLTATCFAELVSFLPESQSQNIVSSLEVIGWNNFDEETRRTIQKEGKKAHLVFFWWQSYVIKALSEETITVPAPMLSRTFAEMGSGLSNFENAVKLSRVPFPVSYTQITLWLLMIHWFLCPLVVLGWSKRPSLAFVFTFILIFVFWALFLTSQELEDPFGDDESDVDMKSMQRYSNTCLRMLLSPGSQRTACFSESAKGGKGDMATSRANFLCMSKSAEDSSDSEDDSMIKIES